MFLFFKVYNLSFNCFSHVIFFFFLLVFILFNWSIISSTCSVHLYLHGTEKLMPNF